MSGRGPEQLADFITHAPARPGIVLLVVWLVPGRCAASVTSPVGWPLLLREVPAADSGQ